jgi:hypothetical protein
MFRELTKSHMSNKWWKLRTELCHKVNKLEIIVLHNKGFSGKSVERTTKSGTSDFMKMPVWDWGCCF